MAWPRFCASSSSAKVESPRMLIRSIGSICTATFRRIHLPAATGMPAYKAGTTDPAMSLTRVERRRDMARDAAGCHEHGVEADVLDALVAMACEPGLGGGDDALALPVAHRPGRVVERVARLHLDEDQQRA